MISVADWSVIDFVFTLNGIVFINYVIYFCFYFFWQDEAMPT